MIAAALPLRRPEAAPRIGVARGRAAQVNHRGEIALLLQRGGSELAAPEDLGDAPVKVGRGHLDGVARHHAQVQAIEPARAPVVPRPVLDHRVVANAIALRLAKSAVGNLVHAHRAGGRPVDLEGLVRQAPTPGSAGHRVAGALELRERGEQLRGHDRRRVLAEDRPVLAPSLGRHLVQRAADREEQLRGLACRLVDPIGAQPQEDGGEDCGDDDERWRRFHQLQQPGGAAGPAPGSGAPRAFQAAALAAGFFSLFFSSAGAAAACSTRSISVTSARGALSPLRKPILRMRR